MTIWALSDPHLSFDTPKKSMEAFGALWKHWTDKIYQSCHKFIKKEDLLLIAGDISWAKNPEQALKDLLWIDDLPGQKIILKGNHDYWWPSTKKLNKILPKSIQALHGNAISFQDISIAGTRLWDSDEFNFDEVIEIKKNPLENKKNFSAEETMLENKKIFERELIRLQLSLDQMDQKAKYRLVMLHYPPIGLDLKESRVHQLLKSYKVDICVFGHLHSLKTSKPLFGEKEGIVYHLTSCDYLNFIPKKIL